MHFCKVHGLIIALGQDTNKDDFTEDEAVDPTDDTSH